MKDTAVILNTLNRFHHTKTALDITLNNAGREFDLFAWDNGSANDRIKDLVRGYDPEWYCEAAENVGNPPAYNQMLNLVKQRGYKYVVMIGSDIILPTNWLEVWYQVYIQTDAKGLLGYDWGLLQEKEVAQFDGFQLAKCDMVYGCWFFSTDMIDKVGYINEEYKMYGKWDSDLNFRLNALGIDSYYVPLRCLHLVDPNERTSEYRAFKNEKLAENEKVYFKQLQKYAKTNNYYVDYDQAK